MAVPTGGRTCKIGPSILNADLSMLASECQRMMDSGSDYLHLDVMDGQFVPNLTFGHPVVKCLRPKLPSVFFDMHMMVAAPEQFEQILLQKLKNQIGKNHEGVNTSSLNPLTEISVPSKRKGEMADAGADQYTFHIETTDDPARTIRKIKEAGMKITFVDFPENPGANLEKAGIGIKPKTPVHVLVPFIDYVDMVLIMTVEPGFGGQKFMADMMPKVQFLREHFPDIDIEVDGGVGPSTIQECAEAGANMFVSGSAVLNSDNPRVTIQALRNIVNETFQKSQLER